MYIHTQQGEARGRVYGRGRRLCLIVSIGKATCRTSAQDAEHKVRRLKRPEVNIDIIAGYYVPTPAYPDFGHMLP